MVRCALEERLNLRSSELSRRVCSVQTVLLAWGLVKRYLKLLYIIGTKLGGRINDNHDGAPSR
jgi:hypothetical protein